MPLSPIKSVKDGPYLELIEDSHKYIETYHYLRINPKWLALRTGYVQRWQLLTFQFEWTRKLYCILLRRAIVFVIRFLYKAKCVIIHNSIVIGIDLYIKTDPKKCTCSFPDQQKRLHLTLLDYGFIRKWHNILTVII